RNPVDAGRAVPGESCGLDAGGICFERNLYIRSDAPVLAYRIQDRADSLRPHQRRRAAAKKDRGHLSARRARRGGFDFAGERARKSFLVDGGMADMAVEIAVRTFRQANRPMQVNAEGCGLWRWR